MHSRASSAIIIALAFVVCAYVTDDSAPAAESRPGLLVVNATVKDQAQFEAYAAKSRPIVTTHKGVPVLRGTNPISLAGQQPHRMVIAFRFPSKAAIREFYDSAEYQALIPSRTAAADMVFTAYEIDQEEAPQEGKALLAVNITVKQPPLFADYGKASRPIVQAHGGKLVLRAINPEVLFGENRYKMLVFFKFPSQDALRAFYSSDAYQKLIPMRGSAAETVSTGFDL